MNEPRNGLGDTSEDTTALLIAWGQGSERAGQVVLERVYDDLKQLAARRLRTERPDHTLQPTALVHETFLRLIEGARVSWQDRTHFFALAGTTMRRILVDWARRRQGAKRGGGAVTLSLHGIDLADQRTPDLLALDDALRTLSAFDARKARIVELHFFAGLSVRETAEVLDCSTATVSRQWRLAKGWLLHQLEARTPEDGQAARTVA